MSIFDDWDSYFYPETIDKYGNGVLRNLLSIRNPRRLREIEYKYTSYRAQELLENPSLVERTFDAAHLKAIHAYLLQDIYEWAGQYRTVNMYKGDSGFADINEIDDFLAEAAFTIKVTDWANLTKRQFVEQAATVFAYVNQAHPFREGNGRSSKMFMRHVAALSQFDFNFKRVPPHVWNRASELCSMRSDGLAIDPKPLFKVFSRCTVPRDPALAKSSARQDSQEFIEPRSTRKNNRVKPGGKPPAKRSKRPRSR